MRFLDCFSGIGGFHVAAQNFGGRCVGSIEIEPIASQIYRDWFPDTPQFSDMWNWRDYNLPQFDLLCGGFPCQAFSNNRSARTAGKIADARDHRQYLCYPLVELLAEYSPTYFVFENVANIQTMHFSDGQSVVDYIAEFSRALGYRVKFVELCARHYAPQVRKRWFAVGSRTIVGALRHSTCQLVMQDVFDETAPQVQPALMLPCQYSHEIRWQKLLDNWRDDYQYVGRKSKLLAEIVNDTPSGVSRQSDRVYCPLHLCPCITTISPITTVKRGQLHTLTTRELMRCQMFPDKCTHELLSQKHVGNSVCVPMVESCLEMLA